MSRGLDDYTGWTVGTTTRFSWLIVVVGPCFCTVDPAGSLENFLHLHIMLISTSDFGLRGLLWNHSQGRSEV